MDSPITRSKANSFKICTLNCRSLLNKHAELQALILNEGIDIICITETWLNQHSPSELFVIPGYNFYRKDRHETCTPWSNLGGGGVAIYVKQNIKSEECPERSSDLAKCEMLTVKIEHRKYPFYLTVIYRPPRQKMDTVVAALDQLQDQFDNAHCILTGDFNAKNSSWKDSDKTDSNGRTLQSAFLKYGFNVVNQGTGTRPNLHGTNNPLLDIFASNNPNISALCRTLAPFSDHCPVLLTLSLPKSTQPNYTENLRRHIDFKLLRMILQREPLLERITGVTSVNAVWQAWETHLLNAIERASTWTIINFKKRKSWYTPDLHKLHRRQNRIYQAYARDRGNVKMKTAYCLVRNIYRKKLRAAKAQFIKNKASSLAKHCKKGSYVWWKKAKRLCNIAIQRSDIPDLTQGKQTISTPGEKALAFARHFSTQCTMQSGVVDPRDSLLSCLNKPDSQIPDAFAFLPFSPGQVHYDLEHLSMRKSTSANDLLPVLKYLADVLCTSLSYIFNLSLSEAQFPTAWKNAKIVPIYKNKGSSGDCANYRPISLLHPISRIFEYRLSCSLTSYLVKNKIISTQQFAYLPQKSCTDQLLLLVHDMAEALDCRGHFSTAFLDFKKAFDRVDHRVLINALSRFTNRNTLNWFRSYLDNRTLQVVIENNHTSPILSINCGVPQGSHLAPILFALYINTLPDVVMHSSPYLFADDVTLFLRHNENLSLADNSRRLNEDLASCQKWALDVNGAFSAEKTTLLSSYGTAENAMMDGTQIQAETSVKHLGVTLTGNLDFTAHYKTIFVKFKQRVNLLCYMGQFLPANVCLLLYKCYVRPTVEYAVPVWCFSLTVAQLSALDILQARVCRRILKSFNIPVDFHESKGNLNEMCHLQSLKYRRQYLSLILMYKFIHFHPEYLERFNVSVTHSARRPNKLVFKKHGKYLSSLFIFRIGMLWNCLPPAITAVSNLSDFKNILSTYTSKYQFVCSGIPT